MKFWQKVGAVGAPPTENPGSYPVDSDTPWICGRYVWNLCYSSLSSDYPGAVQCVQNFVPASRDKSNVSSKVI